MFGKSYENKCEMDKNVWKPRMAVLPITFQSDQELIS